MNTTLDTSIGGVLGGLAGDNQADEVSGLEAAVARAAADGENAETEAGVAEAEAAEAEAEVERLKALLEAREREAMAREAGLREKHKGRFEADRAAALQSAQTQLGFMQSAYEQVGASARHTYASMKH